MLSWVRVGWGGGGGWWGRGIKLMLRAMEGGWGGGWGGAVSFRRWLRGPVLSPGLGGRGVGVGQGH